MQNKHTCKLQRWLQPWCSATVTWQKDISTSRLCSIVAVALRSKSSRISNRYSELFWSSAREEPEIIKASIATCHRPGTSVIQANTPQVCVCVTLLCSSLPRRPTKARQWEVLRVKLVPWDRSSNWVCFLSLSLSLMSSDSNEKS